jgi:F-type H+-transporting ATPase subunit b
LHFYWTSTVFALIAFGILYLLLSKYAFGPLMGIMEKRRTLIQEQLANAEQSKKQAEQLLEQQHDAIQQARKEALEIIEQSKVTSVKQAEDIIAAAKAEAERLKTEAQKDIENEKNKALAELKSQVGQWSVAIATEILGKEINVATQQAVVSQFLQESGGKLKK